MKTALYQWIKAHRIILLNAGSLAGTTAITSGLGFVYWWLAARKFAPEVVGIASASISAMMLLGSLCMLGLGTLLITELPRQPGKEGSLISTALLLVGSVGGAVGVLFALVAPTLSADFRPLRAGLLDVLLFAIGVSLTSVTLVLDQALIGLLRGGLQLWRNTLFSIMKLVVLFVVSLWLSNVAGITIYTTWSIGNAISVVALLSRIIFKRKWARKSYLPQWSLLRKLGFAALQHHLLNLTLQAPTLIMPVLVTVLLSAKMNAWFYVAWMIASFVFVVPAALTTVLHAMNSARPSMLAQQARVTITLACAICLPVDILLLVNTTWVLGLFGSSYATQAVWSLRVLSVAVFPLIIKNHYISICRIQDHISRAMLAMIPGGLLELGAAILGGYLGGVSGLSTGWVVAVSIESLFMLHSVYKATRLIESNQLEAHAQSEKGISAIWQIDTFILSAIEVSQKEAKSIAQIKHVRRGEQQSKRARHSLRPNRLKSYSLPQDFVRDE